MPLFVQAQSCRTDYLFLIWIVASISIIHWHEGQEFVISMTRVVTRSVMLSALKGLREWIQLMYMQITTRCSLM